MYGLGDGLRGYLYPKRRTLKTLKTYPRVRYLFVAKRLSHFLPGNKYIDT